MPDRKQFKEADPTADQHLHTPGGMAQPADDAGRAREGADMASTDMSVNPPSNFGRVQPPEPYQGSVEPGGVPMEPDSSAVQRLERELDELKDRHARLAAEFDNYRKRITRERAELSDRAQAGLIAKLLDVLDDVDRLVAGDPESTPMPVLREGLTLVDRKLRRDLEAAGVERIDPTGTPFNPELHEAVSVVVPPSAEQDHIVAATFQTGYRFKGALIRPARVQVFSQEGHA